MKKMICIALLVAAPALAQTSHDVMFADAMIRHHEDGIRMAQLAVDKATDPELRDMARMMIDVQQREIGLLQSLRGTAPMTPMASMSALEMQRDLARLEHETGPRFDVAFTEIMARHHQGALTMANDELRLGSNAAMKTLARRIAEKQSGERTRLLAMNRERTDLQPMVSSSSTAGERERMRKD